MYPTIIFIFPGLSLSRLRVCETFSVRPHLYDFVCVQSLSEYLTLFLLISVQRFAKICLSLSLQRLDFLPPLCYWFWCLCVCPKKEENKRVGFSRATNNFLPLRIALQLHVYCS
ncbi:unnamed protein product [Calicophoron daubneyi]|uniref:Uncharacterized protein n=1 Tax=Calicophoron daubneyi TaxID=300641 RepID=A0AAV2T284_CALDB